MLWTVVVAILLGALLHSGLGTVAIVVSVCWATAVGIVRMTTNWKVAFWFSSMGAACLRVLDFIVAPVTDELSVRHLSLAFGTIDGFCAGLVCFLLVEGTYRGIIWADNLLRTKTTENPS
jgi:hypothetical protein